VVVAARAGMPLEVCDNWDQTSSLVNQEQVASAATSEVLADTVTVVKASVEGAWRHGKPCEHNGCCGGAAGRQRRGQSGHVPDRYRAGCTCAGGRDFPWVHDGVPCALLGLRTCRPTGHDRPG